MVRICGFHPQGPSSILGVEGYFTYIFIGKYINKITIISKIDFIICCNNFHCYTMLKNKSKKTNRKIYPKLKAKNHREGKLHTDKYGTTWKVCVKTNGAHYWKRHNETQKNKQKSILKKKTSPKKKKSQKNKKPRINDRKRYLNSIRGITSNYMEGHYVVLTGVMWDTPKNIEECLTRHGSFVSSRITKKTTALVVGNDNVNRRIINKADQLGLHVVNSDDLYDALYN